MEPILKSRSADQAAKCEISVSAEQLRPPGKTEEILLIKTTAAGIMSFLWVTISQDKVYQSLQLVAITVAMETITNQSVCDSPGTGSGLEVSFWSRAAPPFSRGPPRASKLR